MNGEHCFHLFKHWLARQIKATTDTASLQQAQLQIVGELTSKPSFHNRIFGEVLNVIQTLNMWVLMFLDSYKTGRGKIRSSPFQFVFDQDPFTG